MGLGEDDSGMNVPGLFLEVKSREERHTYP